MSKKEITPEKIAKEIKTATTVALFGHVSPDGDCYGALLGLKIGLESIGKRVLLFTDEDLPDAFSFLYNYGPIVFSNNYSEAELVLVLDSSDFKRVEKGSILTKYKKEKTKIILVDHHVTGDLVSYSDHHWVDQKKSSASEMALEILLELGVSIKKDIATFLLVGIETDTFSFQNQNTTKETLESAAFLVSKGARLGLIVQNAFETKTLNIAKIYGLALERLIFNKKYNIVSTYITEEDMQKYNVGDEALSGVANYLNSIDGTKAVFLIAEKRGGLVKVSLRTRDDDVDLSSLAKMVGGGGHKKASGFELKGKLKSKGGKIKVVD